MNILQDAKSKTQYDKLMFSDMGYEILFNYSKSLLKEYGLKTEKDYPFKLGLVFGIPYFDFVHEFKSKDEHLGRIKICMQLLGIDYLSVELNNGSKIELNFKKVNK